MDASGVCQLDRGSGLTRYLGNKTAELIAFANRATLDCSDGVPLVFSNVSFHISWILNVPGVLEDIAKGADNMPCTGPRAGGRISGSVEATVDRFPYSVSVRRKGQLHICQGALIGPRHVVTAASCVSPKQFSASDLEAHIGGLRREPEAPVHGDMIGIREVRFHPTFRTKGEQIDLAILELEEASTKKPIRLPKQSEICR